MKREDIIWQSENRVSGALCFTGTRVPVKTLIDHLKDGYTIDDVLEGFPSVSREQAQAFLELSHELAEEAIIPEDARADARTA